MEIPINLSPGAYALRAFIDVNNNGILDTQLAGKPEEPFAISSKNGRPSLRFNRAVVQLSTEKPAMKLVFLHPKQSSTPMAHDAEAP